MKKRLENKIAVITGAGGTLCSEIAIQLALDGSKVFLVKDLSFSFYLSLRSGCSYQAFRLWWILAPMMPSPARAQILPAMARMRVPLVCSGCARSIFFGLPGV